MSLTLTLTLTLALTLILTLQVAACRCCSRPLSLDAHAAYLDCSSLLAQVPNPSPIHIPIPNPHRQPQATLPLGSTLPQAQPYPRCMLAQGGRRKQPPCWSATLRQPSRC